MRTIKILINLMTSEEGVPTSLLAMILQLVLLGLNCVYPICLLWEAEAQAQCN